MIKTTAFAGVLLVATSALAQPKPPGPSPQPTPQQTPAPSPQTPPATDEQKKADARRLYEEGLQHYNLGEYDSAISKFKAAYAISSAVVQLYQ